MKHTSKKGKKNKILNFLDAVIEKKFILQNLSIHISSQNWTIDSKSHQKNSLFVLE